MKTINEYFREIESDREKERLDFLLNLTSYSQTLKKYLINTKHEKRVFLTSTKEVTELFVPILTGLEIPFHFSNEALYLGHTIIENHGVTMNESNE